MTGNAHLRFELQCLPRVDERALRDRQDVFSGVFATALASWAAGNSVTLGPTAQAGAQFVFDITLYAQISGLNTPVLRLRTLQLALSDIAV